MVEGNELPIRRQRWKAIGLQVWQGPLVFADGHVHGEARRQIVQIVVTATRRCGAVEAHAVNGTEDYLLAVCRNPRSRRPFDAAALCARRRHADASQAATAGIPDEHILGAVRVATDKIAGARDERDPLTVPGNPRPVALPI